jgi:flagellar biosynthesis GTPase FlhF
LSSDHKTDREEKSLELYNYEGKTTRDIAKDVRMSLRDINIILKKHVVNHGIAIVDNKKSSKKLPCLQGYSRVQVAVELELY